MRKKYANFLDIDEIQFLLKDFKKYNKNTLLTELLPAPVKRVFDQLSADFDFEVKDKSYWRLERRPSGHGWHKDTGTNNHMAWCQVGASILLTGDFTGGNTYYSQDETLQEVKEEYRELGDLLAHTSDVWHKVDNHDGNRTVLLMFI
jgi:hypothetical protein